MPPAMSPRDLWIETTGNVVATLTSVYPPWAGEANIESQWYRLAAGGLHPDFELSEDGPVAWNRLFIHPSRASRLEGLPLLSPGA